VDPATVASIALGALNNYLGDKCPKCGTKSLIRQKDKGETWFGNKKKVECGSCGHTFKVKAG